MNSSNFTLVNSMAVYATTNISHSEHMAEMHHNPANATMSEEDNKRFCGDSKINSNLFVSEFVLPGQCSQPVGLAVVKDNNIWVASGKLGSLFVFNTTTLEFDKIIEIPNWPEQTRIMGSMIWNMKFDKNGVLISSLLVAPVLQMSYAHQRALFEINGKDYLFIVGSANEPIFVDDKTKRCLGSNFSQCNQSD